MRSHVIHGRKDNTSNNVTSLMQETSSPLSLKVSPNWGMNKYLLDTQYVHSETTLLL